MRVVRGDIAAERSKIDFRVVTVAGTARELEDFNPLDEGECDTFDDRVITLF